MTLRIQKMSLKDLFAALPIDQDLKPQDRGVAFTGEVPGIPAPPSYLDPSSVACWYLGYLSAKSETTGEDMREIVLRHYILEDMEGK